MAFHPHKNIFQRNASASPSRLIKVSNFTVWKCKEKRENSSDYKNNNKWFDLFYISQKHRSWQEQNVCFAKSQKVIYKSQVYFRKAKANHKKNILWAFCLSKLNKKKKYVKCEGEEEKVLNFAQQPETERCKLWKFSRFGSNENNEKLSVLLSPSL